MHFTIKIWNCLTFGVGYMWTCQEQPSLMNCFLLVIQVRNPELGSFLITPYLQLKCHQFSQSLWQPIRSSFVLFWWPFYNHCIWCKFRWPNLVLINMEVGTSIQFSTIWSPVFYTNWGTIPHPRLHCRGHFIVVDGVALITCGKGCYSFIRALN